MLRHRYNRTDLFALVPQLDLRFEPQLEQLDRLLDDDEIVEAVRSDMARRSPRSRSRGRPSTPVEVALRMLVVMRPYGWSFEQAEYFVNDSLVLRQFCRVYLEKVPDDTTPIRWAGLIGPGTLEQLNDRAARLARSLKVTRGRKLRVDTTAVEADIHYPTDSALIGDGVRVLSRLLRRAKGILGGAAGLGRGIRQAWRRVINGEAVPAKEKLVSVFEPHTQIVPRHKAGNEVEFGRKVRLDEVEGGIVSGYRVLEQGGGQDYPYLADSLT